MDKDEAASKAPDRQTPRLRERDWWPASWARAIADIGSVTPARREAVLRDIDEGSSPTTVYYVLLGISELIAGFALIVDSDATLIGANVVAPLMTPIFGVSLGLMRGDLKLLRKALMAEFGGAILGGTLCYLLGLLPFIGDPSPVLLAQTRPTLIDLLVAALAGFAGVLAMIDERVSPALPGVAIATALNPPIAAIGLCLASGAYAGAFGALLLFFANVLAILAVAAVLFIVAGFVTRAEIGSITGLARRFAAAGIGLLLVTVLLSNHLANLVHKLRTERAIHSVLDQGLSEQPNTALVSVDFSRGPTGIDVLSTIRAPRVMSPETVKVIQDALSERLGEPVQLFMRCVLTADVSATGSTNVRPYLSLNGRVAEAPMSPTMRLLQQAEQVARETAGKRPELVLKDVDLVKLPAGPVIVIAIESPRTPTAEEVGRFEARLRERLQEPSLRLVLRRTASVDMTSKGRILFGEAHLVDAGAAEAQARDTAEKTVRDRIEALPHLFAPAVDAVKRDDGWDVRAEVVGPRVLTPAEVRDIEQRSAKELGQPVRLSVWARTELKVTDERYEPLGD